MSARRTEPSAVLASLADGYGTWLDEQRRKARSLPFRAVGGTDANVTGVVTAVPDANGTPGSASTTR
ncbi:hypothetical protein KYY02_23795 [Streptomyces pimonensis]|uniref:Uncharacterized protein n=1 Tax=Streptomyces pimonensis TaxID=2860288 RepID=A0ABV4J7K8_9ACTN